METLYFNAGSGKYDKREIYLGLEPESYTCDDVVRPDWVHVTRNSDWTGLYVYCEENVNENYINTNSREGDVIFKQPCFERPLVHVVQSGFTYGTLSSTTNVNITAYTVDGNLYLVYEILGYDIPSDEGAAVKCQYNDADGIVHYYYISGAVGDYEDYLGLCDDVKNFKRDSEGNWIEYDKCYINKVSTDTKIEYIEDKDDDSHFLTLKFENDYIKYDTNSFELIISAKTGDEWNITGLYNESGDIISLNGTGTSSYQFEKKLKPSFFAERLTVSGSLSDNEAITAETSCVIYVDVDVNTILYSGDSIATTAMTVPYNTKNIMLNLWSNYYWSIKQGIITSNPISGGTNGISEKKNINVYLSYINENQDDVRYTRVETALCDKYFLLTQEKAPSITLTDLNDESEVNVNADGGELNLKIQTTYANDKWKILSSNSIDTLHNQSQYSGIVYGTGTTDSGLSVIYQKNESADDFVYRTLTATLSGYEGYTTTSEMTLIQDKATPYINLYSGNSGTTKINVPYSFTGGTLALSSNTKNWQISVSDSSCSVTPSMGSSSIGKHDIKYTCGINLNTDEYDVVLSANAGSISDSFTITQAGCPYVKLYYYDAYSTEITYKLIDYAAHIKSPSLIIKSNTDWTISAVTDSENWNTYLNINNITGTTFSGHGDSQAYICCSENSSIESNNYVRYILKTDDGIFSAETDASLEQYDKPYVCVYYYENIKTLKYETVEYNAESLPEICIETNNRYWVINADKNLITSIYSVSGCTGWTSADGHKSVCSGGTDTSDIVATFNKNYTSSQKTMVLSANTSAKGIEGLGEIDAYDYFYIVQKPYPGKTGVTLNITNAKIYFSDANDHSDSGTYDIVFYDKNNTELNRFSNISPTTGSPINKSSVISSKMYEEAYTVKLDFTNLNTQDYYVATGDSNYKGEITVTFNPAQYSTITFNGLYASIVPKESDSSGGSGNSGSSGSGSGSGGGSSTSYNTLTLSYDYDCEIMTDGEEGNMKNAYYPEKKGYYFTSYIEVLLTHGYISSINIDGVSKNISDVTYIKTINGTTYTVISANTTTTMILNT